MRCGLKFQRTHITTWSVPDRDPRVKSGAANATQKESVK